MTRVFADTSFFVAAIDPRDQHRFAAQQAIASLHQPEIHTCDEVLAEVLTFFSRKTKMRVPATRYLRGILANPNIVVHEQSRDSLLQTLSLYEARHDKAFSAVDCRAMWLMRALGITKVLTNDAHFEQAGFEKLH